MWALYVSEERTLYKIRRAVFPDDLNDILSLYREYVATTTADLKFQKNNADFERLEINYREKHSQIFIAFQSSEAIGCAAYRKHNDEVCEMKRVYVRPQARGYKVGEALVKMILNESIGVGYKKMCLDVLPEFVYAQKLYERLGFVPHDPITYNPVKGTKYLAIDLETYNNQSQQDAASGASA
jgi:ribosomal protein S18 acetylase RimI-like enzyme